MPTPVSAPLPGSHGGSNLLSWWWLRRRFAKRLLLLELGRGTAPERPEYSFHQFGSSAPWSFAFHSKKWFVLLLTTENSKECSFKASGTSSPPGPPRCPVRGAGGSLTEASTGWRADGCHSVPAAGPDHSTQHAAPASDFLAAGCWARRDVRFDCSHWKHRVVVASPCRSNLLD